MAVRQLYSKIMKYFDNKEIKKKILSFENESVTKWLNTWWKHPYNHWAMAATDLLDLYRLILEVRPNCIVEYGTATGYSTVVMAYALKEIGAGRIVSLEQDADMHEFAKKVSPIELNDYIDYRLSPITIMNYGSQPFVGYKHNFDFKIDLAVVDGPVGFVIDSPVKGLFFNFYAAKRVSKYPSLSNNERKIFAENMNAFGKNHVLDSLEVSELRDLGLLNADNEVSNSIARKGALYQIFANAAEGAQIIVDGSFSEEWVELIKLYNYDKLKFGTKSNLLIKNTEH